MLQSEVWFDFESTVYGGFVRKEASSPITGWSVYLAIEMSRGTRTVVASEDDPVVLRKFNLYHWGFQKGRVGWVLDGDEGVRID